MRDESDWFEGGAFVLYDEPVEVDSRRRELSAFLGDVILFCSCERLERTAHGWATRAVLHGAELVIRGSRYVLGVPFHEYR